MGELPGMVYNWKFYRETNKKSPFIRYYNWRAPPKLTMIGDYDCETNREAPANVYHTGRAPRNCLHLVKIATKVNMESPLLYHPERAARKVHNGQR